MTRTVLRGRANEAQRKLWETVKAGQALALKRIKAGVDGMTIHKAIQELFASRGFTTGVRNGRRVGFFHGTGHGLGLEIHEHPRLQKVVLKDRQVLTVEPGLYYPGVGGTRQEDVVVVTKTGCRILSRFPKQLEIWKLPKERRSGRPPCFYRRRREAAAPRSQMNAQCH